MRAGVAAGVAVLLLAGCTSSHHRAPRPPAPTTHVPLVDDAHVQRLHGMPLPGRLGVAVLDGNKLIDLDTHRPRKIAGLPGGHGWVTANRVGANYLISVERGETFVLPDGATKARLISTDASWAAPGRGGVWLTRGSRKCTLAKVSMTGRTILPARPINCKYQILEETPRGLIANTGQDQALLDRQLRPTAHGSLIGVAGKTLITTDGSRINVAGRGSVRLPHTVGGLDELLVSPDNRYVAVDVANPACPGPRQCLDTWILRLATMQWIHPPSMPVSMYLKPHNLYWSPDDRFTWLGSFVGVGAAIATWQPGATALRMRQISLPAAQYGVLHS